MEGRSLHRNEGERKSCSRRERTGEPCKLPSSDAIEVDEEYDKDGSESSDSVDNE